ncbi:MAG: SxtJ family membrane protein [Alphaproteobacteria bacterium]|nr:SxtJ family membrane protein [Alphaproteobacteria bacterium]
MSEIEGHVEIKRGSERGFGIVFAIVFALIGLYPLWNGDPVRLWAMIIAVAFLALALIAPRTLALPNRLWFRLGMALGAVVAPIVMFVVYAIAVVPVGLIMRLLGKDLLRQRLDQNAKSYWIDRERPVGSMKDQF